MKRITSGETKGSRTPFAFAFWQYCNAGEGTLNKNAVINISQKWQFLQKQYLNINSYQNKNFN
jgi:hypothetical protein